MDADGYEDFRERVIAGIALTMINMAGKAASAHVVREQARLVAPVDLGPFLPGVCRNLRIARAQRAFDRRRRLFVGMPDRLLRCEAPALAVGADGAHRYANAERMDRKVTGLCGPMVGGHCDYNEYLVDGDRMLEVSECKQAFNVRPKVGGLSLMQIGTRKFGDENRNSRRFFDST